MKSLKERGIREEMEVPVPIPTDDGSGIAETILVRVMALRDPETGDFFLDGEALETIDKAKSRHLGLLSSDEIKALRQRLHLTQEQLSQLLRIGEKTYTRWESGRSRPSQVMNLLLLLLRDGTLNISRLQAYRKPNFNWFGACACISWSGTVELPAIEPATRWMKPAQLGLPHRRKPSVKVKSNEQCWEVEAHEELAVAA